MTPDESLQTPGEPSQPPAEFPAAPIESAAPPSNFPPPPMKPLSAPPRPPEPIESPEPLRPSHWLRNIVIALVILAVLFYVEEDWRGWKAWNSCQQTLQAQGTQLNWADYIPAPVPDNDNIFAVPEMQKWFVGKGSNELTQLLQYPGSASTARLIVAHLTISLPGASLPTDTNAVEVQSQDSNAKEQIGRLIRQAVGTVVVDPAGPFYTKKQPDTIRPAQVYVLCQTSPSAQDLAQLIPSPLLAPDSSSNEETRVERAEDGSYNVTIRKPGSVEEFLKWNEQLTPQFTLISNAVQRPDARIPGDYEIASEIPVPNLLAVRTLAQRLGSLSRCYMALGQASNALDELTFMHQLCRVLEARPAGKPITLGAAMMNVALTEGYISFIEDGMRGRIWREPQLAALQGQLKEINLRPLVADSVQEDTASVCQMAERHPWKLFNYAFAKRRAFLLAYVVPKGWIYQNMVNYANLQQNWIDGFGGTNNQIAPLKIDGAAQAMSDFPGTHRHSPFRYMAAMEIPNLSRFSKTLVNAQTKANQAQIVCALDRFHLTEGEFPAALEPLTLLYLGKIPDDIIGGLPPHYTRHPDGTFLLYSVGWDEMDHHGLNGVDIVWGGK